MATIINNSATADENKSRIQDPYLYVADPKSDKPLFNAQLFFGLPGQDPELEDQRKIAYAIQNSGVVTPIDQPVRTSAGGVPEYNGSPISIAVSGDFSYKVLDKDGALIYYQPRVKSPNAQGFSGVVAEEAKEVSSGQVSAFSSIEATTASFYVSSTSNPNEFNGRYMRKDVDYQVLSTSVINLLTTYSDGTVIIGRQMDPTGQIIPTTEGASALFVFDLIDDAVQSDLQVGDTLTINGGTVVGDGLGGAKYITVANGTGTDDGENFITLNNGNQIKLIPNNLKLIRYSEEINELSIVSSDINIDLNLGNVHTVNLDENVSDVLFLNANPLPSSTTITLRVTQDGGANGITWPASILWSGGTAPTVTSADGALDIYAFTSYDGVTWFGSVVGQDFS